MNNGYRNGLPRIPARVLTLPVDSRGYPVPFFVQWIDGKPDFRVVDPAKFVRCVTHELCWICGAPLGRFKTFVAGPISGVTLVSGEPPSHFDCAEFAARACPFLLLPKAQRREANLPDKVVINESHLDRNPGVCMLWTCHVYRIHHLGRSVLLQMGDALHVAWFSQGRPATRAEVIESVQSGLPLLDAQETILGESVAQAVERLTNHYPVAT